MTRDQAFTRLGQLDEELRGNHIARSTAWQAWHQAKFREVDGFLRQGLSATAADKAADAACVGLRVALVGIEADITRDIEERDHLRFLIQHDAFG